MAVPVFLFSPGELIRYGLKVSDSTHYQASRGELIKATLQLGEGTLSDTGALVVETGKFTGRSPKDRFIVKDHITTNTVNWNDINLPLETHYFDIIFSHVTAYLNSQPELWVRDCYACADAEYRFNIRIVNEKPWINLFAANMFLQPTEEELEDFGPHWHIFSASGLQLPYKACGIRQENAVVISFKHKMILIAGTAYTGEIKKAVFSVLNYLLPIEKNVLGMHCAANIGAKNDAALFFGLSGTGKTTLSTSPERKLIGDDEHGWSDEGIFNFEGGCYAKCIGLEEDKEPDIYKAIRYGALVENTRFISGTDRIDFFDKSITENTRVSYPLHFISNIAEPSQGAAPDNIFFLTCDAYGVLPPVSRLTREQAMYHFISGYTAKIAGTETGITEPKVVFSACFGAPFLPLHPVVYTKMLGEKLHKHEANVWLINTGWTGGSYGTGKRILLRYTRAIIHAALHGKLNDAVYSTDKFFGLAVPQSCPGVPYSIINPENAWNDKNAYVQTAKKLAGQFIKNFEQYGNTVPAEIMNGGPVLL
ncbi:phosphoenolpyruvate carboxykinase (ATP) [Agriterribacter sp.]|uniref:phosphoenolpyruvate carboxykinase (ATP) n=1 Tax=Agriterribacter sp. TaxID=2821509 RepID=UPI002B947FCA|nr:phosphoenolpyruvate carboxykinase (ATP) [Agriterribacter sp.]HRP57655.1 phosphoenolpyruvate carboxykinase (ATP) [Agriterribacter sp.]